MPYEWLTAADRAPEISGALSHGRAAPSHRLHLWPYRSLPRAGFVWFIGGTAALITVPLLAVLGSPVMWGLLPFLALAVGGVWWALNRSYRDGEIIEDLTLWPDRVELVRHGPRGARQDWQANPHWVRVVLHPKGGPVPHYLTLKGGSREVEIGAFLTEAERIALQTELSEALRGLK